MFALRPYKTSCIVPNSFRKWDFSGENHRIGLLCFHYMRLCWGGGGVHQNATYNLNMNAEWKYFNIHLYITNPVTYYLIINPRVAHIHS